MSRPITCQMEIGSTLCFSDELSPGICRHPAGRFRVIMPMRINGATLLYSPIMVAEEHLGPAVYLAAVHDVDGQSVLHWKYNIAKPEFVEFKVLDGKKRFSIRSG